MVVAKLRRPRRREGELTRRRLIETLVGVDRPVVAVRAPAGYGKTTAVRQWIDADRRLSAWVSLDAADNDPVRLLRHVVRAVDGVTPVSEVEALLALEPPPLVDVVSAFATALDERDPIVVVLDDVQVLDEPSVVGLLDRLVGALPPGSALALVGRSVPALLLSRRVAGDDALVLGREQLAFTGPELRSVVAATLPGLADERVEHLFERTEGWPAGVHLSLLAAKAAPRPDVVLTDLPHRAADLGAYVHEELLRHLDPDLEDFLVRTSVLDRLSPALCDFVLGRGDSASVLRRLVDSENLFVVAHDDEPEWLRYHHLFADLLLVELRASRPDLEPGLRRRAAEWHGAHGDPDAAVTQALAAGAPGRAAELAYRHVHSLVQHGSIGTIERWLRGFAPDEAHRHPLLMLLHGWLALGQGRVDDVRRWLDLVAGASWDGPLPDGPPSLAVARASLAMLYSGDGVKQTARDAHLVREAGPGAGPWWSTACLFEANASALADRGADAVALYEDAEFAARGHPATHVVCLSHLAWARFRTGDDRGGFEAASAAYAGLWAHHLEGYNLAVHVHAVHAYAAARHGRRGDYEAGDERTHELIATLGPAVPRAQCQLRLVLAEGALLLGDTERADALVAAAEPFLAAEPDAVVLWDWVDALTSRLAERRRRQGAVDRHRLTDAELRVLAELPTHRSLEEIGRALYISRNTVKTHAVAIYRKLGVSGRSAAVERARVLGLVDAG